MVRNDYDYENFLLYFDKSKKKKMWIDFLHLKLLSKFLYTTNFFIYISVYIMFILFFQN